MIPRLTFSMYRTPSRKNWRKIYLNERKIGKVWHEYNRQTNRDEYWLDMNLSYRHHSLFGRFDSMKDAQNAVSDHIFRKKETP